MIYRTERRGLPAELWEAHELGVRRKEASMEEYAEQMKRATGMSESEYARSAVKQFGIDEDTAYMLAMFLYEDRVERKEVVA